MSKGTRNKSKVEGGNRTPVRINSDILNEYEELMGLHSCKAIHAGIKMLNDTHEFLKVKELPPKRIKDFKSPNINSPKNVSLYPTLSNAECNFLKKRYGIKNSNISEIIRCFIYEMIFLLKRNNENIQKATKIKLDVYHGNKALFRITGQKNKEMCKHLNLIFNEVVKICPSYKEVFTGTANPFFNLNSVFNSYELNEINKRTVTFLKVLKKSPNEFKQHLQLLGCSKEIFENIINYEKLNAGKFKNDIQNAVCLFYLTFCSYHNNNKTFNNKLSQTSYYKALSRINHLSEKLKNIKITRSHALYFLQKYINCSDLLLYVDPPYPYTEGYYEDSDEFKHEKLSKILCEFKGKFVYSCRTTFSNSNRRKGFPDYEMRLTIDKLFKNKGLFYKDIPLTNKANTQIERIITNFYFEGATEYK